MDRNEFGLRMVYFPAPKIVGFQESEGVKINYEYSNAQVEIFETFPSHYQYMVIPKGRRFGATHGASIYCILQASGKNILWIDTVQVNLDSIYRRYFLNILKQMPAGTYNYRPRRMDLQIGTGTVYFRSADQPKKIEDFSYDTIILNEAGIILKGQHGRGLWNHTIYPLTMDSTKVFLMGTPKGKLDKAGKETLYYELAKKGGLGKTPYDKLMDNTIGSKWICKTYSTYDNPWNDKANIAEAWDGVPPSIRQQEIYGQFI
jgi:hypothetical protein